MDIVHRLFPRSTNPSPQLDSQDSLDGKAIDTGVGMIHTK